jgi:hypothetical protein
MGLAWRAPSFERFVAPFQGMNLWVVISQGVALGFHVMAFQAGNPMGE